MPTPSAPNILLILSDQHRYDCLGCHGHPLLRTPHLDALAATGTDFTDAYCPVPLCTPARASLMTGAWPTRHLCIANPDTEAPRPPLETLPMWSELLAQRGYGLDYIGKWHVDRQRDPTAFGFDRYVGEGAYGPYRDSIGRPITPPVSRWFGEADASIEPGQSRLAWGADRVITMLGERGGGDQPFLIRWDPSEPHLPNRVPEPYATMYPLGSIEPWPSFAETFEGKPFIQQQQLRTWGIDDWSWEQWAPIVQRYLGEITLMDHQIGRVLAELDRLGLADDTIVIYSSDHGDMCGGHRMIDKHFVMYDDVMRVPLIVRWPGQTAGRSDAFVSNGLDLAATLVDAAGAQTPGTFQGVSLRPDAAGRIHTGRDDIYGMYHGNQFGLYSQRMLRDRRWKYIWNATAEDELYDLQSDPAELHNRATDPSCRQRLSDMRSRLVGWMERAEDRLLNPWTRSQLLGTPL